MSKKVGRNEPCPCGSGKKLKHCCKDSEKASPDFFKQKTESKKKKEVSELELYFQKYDSKHILNLLIGLQLMPENHGKNVRIEFLVNLLYKSLNVGESIPKDNSLLYALLLKEHPKNHLEDIPENLFCENVIFFGG